MVLTSVITRMLVHLVHLVHAMGHLFHLVN